MLDIINYLDSQTCWMANHAGGYANISAI